MSSILSLGISGIRGYSPDQYQKINFLKPLTLIWGQNGSGKTTIIECLKYITTGSLPPNCDKGKSFIMDNKVAGKPQVMGDIRLIFEAGDRKILAKRRIQLSAKGNSSKFESIEQVLSTRGDNGEQLTINHHCAQIEKQVPHLLNISKPILQNIVFCHQQESMWPFGDSAILKNIFDELFETNPISKEMESMWEIHNELRTQLKELKIRIEYEKQDHKKQLDHRSKMFLQLEELKLKTKDMAEKKKKIISMRGKLKETSEISKSRDQLILRQGRLTSSIKTLETKIRTWKQNIMRVERNHQEKMQGKSGNGFEEDESIGVSRGYMPFNDKRPFSEQQLATVNFLPIVSAEAGMQQLEEKRLLFAELKAKYKQVKEEFETMQAFKETTKREQQIRSEQERIKSLCPEMKLAVSMKTDEEFLRLFRQKLTEMEQKMQGVQISKAKLKALEKGLPPMMELGFNEQETEVIKMQSKDLQAELSSASVKLLKIFKSQHQLIPGGKNIIPTPAQLLRGQLAVKQLESLKAIIQSKQEQLETYEKLTKSHAHSDKTQLKKHLQHYRIAGIEIQKDMMLFCQEKKKCYFCCKTMTQTEIQAALQRVQSVKQRAQEKIKQLQNKLREQPLNLDPDVMVQKLKEEISKLQTKQPILKAQVIKFQQQIIISKKNQTNTLLAKQLQKCNLSLDMLPKLTHVIETDPQHQDQYGTVPLEKFVEMSSSYQVKLARYRGVKQQAKKIEDSKRENQLNRQKREIVVKEKAEMEAAITQAENETKGYDFLKNSYQKLESLLRMDTKSKNKKSRRQQSSSDNNSLTIEEMEISMRQLYVNILEEKTYMEKLQISIGHQNDIQLLNEEKKDLDDVEKQLVLISTDLKSSEQLLGAYNNLSLEFTRESERQRHRLQGIKSCLETPFSPSYLQTLNKIRHLEAAIAHIEMSYHLLEESVNQYHTQKMEEINRCIYETWRDVYHGDDIEWIEIEAVLDAGGRKKKKFYDYRIMMKKSTRNFGKKQQKVQMKGRCSTGQKVLASIVIRLALAQVFCCSTRMLALDEPTTNLDKEHIINLAESLLRLIELSGAKNLQLIVISHDINFIKMLQKYAESYYEIKRDKDRFSTIEKRLVKDIYQGSDQHQ